MAEKEYGEDKMDDMLIVEGFVLMPETARPHIF